MSYEHQLTYTLIEDSTVPLSFCSDADTVMDAVEFVLQNFTEMNKLWVRLQLQVRWTSMNSFLLPAWACMAPKCLLAIELKMSHECMIFGHADVMVLVNHSYSLAILS